MCRHLTKEQRLHIVLSTSELIEELEYEAKERKLKNLKQNTPTGSDGPDGKQSDNNKPDTRTNAKLAELAGVGRATVVRAKKVNRICKC